MQDISKQIKTKLQAFYDDLYAEYLLRKHQRKEKETWEGKEIEPNELEKTLHELVQNFEYYFKAD